MMSLPTFFTTSESYLEDCLRFFEKYQDLYKIANTDILLHHILDKIHVDNLDYDEVVLGHDSDLANLGTKNDYLSEFFEEFNKFRISYDEFTENEFLESTVNVPICPKKKHEIVYLAKEIKAICYETSCDIIIDFGSGLGCLDQLLYETMNFKILGIECNEKHYVGAKKRQRKHHIDSLQHVKYMNHTITQDSDKNIQEYVTKKFGISNFCITGLHACADLTIDGVTLFLKMPRAKGFVVMPCCYHKMALDDTNARKIKNFPLSHCLKVLFHENKNDEYIGVPFLRLAAQPPNRDESLEDLVFNLLARATLQFYANEHGYKVRRNKRKAVRTKMVNRDFSLYLNNAATGFTLTHDDLEVHMDFEEVQSIWRETQKLRLQAAIFILLQRNLQPIIENFILYDRLLFLKENGAKNTYVKKIFNEKVSPKCLALISLK